METKTCKTCREILPATPAYFYFSEGRPEHECKRCKYKRNVRNSQIRKNNPSRARINKKDAETINSAIGKMEKRKVLPIDARDNPAYLVAIHKIADFRTTIDNLASEAGIWQNKETEMIVRLSEIETKIIQIKKQILGGKK